MRVIVCGPRDWTDEELVNDVLSAELSPEDVVITGGCKGVDSIAAKWAFEACARSAVYQADWKSHGKSAGPRRNQAMIDTGQAQEVIAFKYRGRETPGTNDMIRRAQQAGLPVQVFYDKPDAAAV